MLLSIMGAGRQRSRTTCGPRVEGPYDQAGRLGLRCRCGEPRTAATQHLAVRRAQRRRTPRRDVQQLQAVRREARRGERASRRRTRRSRVVPCGCPTSQPRPEPAEPAVRLPEHDAPDQQRRVEQERRQPPGRAARHVRHLRLGRRPGTALAVAQRSPAPAPSRRARARRPARRAAGPAPHQRSQSAPSTSARTSCRRVDRAHRRRRRRGAGRRHAAPHACATNAAGAGASGCTRTCGVLTPAPAGRDQHLDDPLVPGRRPARAARQADAPRDHASSPACSPRGRDELRRPWRLAAAGRYDRRGQPQPRALADQPVAEVGVAAPAARRASAGEHAVSASCVGGGQVVLRHAGMRPASARLPSARGAHLWTTAPSAARPSYA